MEANSSNLAREVTPEHDPAQAPSTERDERQSSERIRGSVHQLLDQMHTIAPPLLQFTHKWGDIHKEYAAVEKLLRERTKELDLKERLLMERSVELEKKEELFKDVVERERKVGLLEKSLEEKEKENEVKRNLVSSLLMRMDCETASEAVMVLEERGREIERLSKCNDERSRELDRAVKEFDLKRKEWIEQLEDREKKLSLLDEVMKEKVSELEKKQERFDAEQMVKAEDMELKRKEMLSELQSKEKGFDMELKAKAEEMELKCKEKLAEVEKKEMAFEVELKAKADEMDVKEKKLDEREKELELKHRELEQFIDKLKEREKETNSAYLAPASAENEEEPEKVIVDSEFHDFKKTLSSFVVGKTWALYDPQDDMPRLYARIKRINKSRLSLDVTWVEPKDDESVPVACGRFKYGRVETVSYLAFSHEVKPVILGRNISVHPKEGETWALFKDWSKNPIQHKPPYRYDLVEVVLGFKDHQGVGVTYLGKVEGFVSVFKHTAQNEVFERMIGPNEMHRFSHRVPSVRLSGEEKEGVPAGSFELDPAAVPSYILLGEKEPDVVQVSSAEDVPLLLS